MGNFGGTLNETWQDFTNANRFVGIGNLASSTDNNFFNTGIQLEVGSVATPFEHRSYGEELASRVRGTLKKVMIKALMLVLQHLLQVFNIDIVMVELNQQIMDNNTLVLLFTKELHQQ